MIVDVHSHYFPAEVARSVGSFVGLSSAPPAADGARVTVSVRGTDLVVPAAVADLDAQLAAMDEQGLDRRALQPPPFTVLYELDATDGTTWSRLVNEGMAAAAAQDPHRLIGFATVPLQAGGDVAAKELAYAIDSLGLGGVELLTSVCGGGLDAAELDEFWAAAAELAVPVVIHPHYVGAAERMDDWYLRNVVGNPTESTLAGARLVCSGILTRYPQLRVVLCHGGGALPHLIGRLRHAYRHRPEFADALDPDDGLRRLYYDTVVFDPTVLRHVSELVGADRLVVGTDFPFDMGEPRPVEFVRGAGLRDTDVATILHAGDRLFAST